MRDYLVIFMDGSKVEQEATNTTEAALLASASKIMKKNAENKKLLSGGNDPSVTVKEVIGPEEELA